jgi:fumarate hydratase class II
MDKPTRIEHDTLGDVLVPASALYGAQTQRAVNNFNISGLRPWRAFIWSMAVIKRAAAEVNRDLGLLDGDIAGAIITAAQEVIDGKWDDQFVVDPFQAGAGTSHNMNVNEVIANRASEACLGNIWLIPTTMSTCHNRPMTPSPLRSAWAVFGAWMSC